MGPLFKDLYKIYPNDMDLGIQARILSKHLNHNGLIEMSKKYPNDMELGSELRKELIKLIKMKKIPVTRNGVIVGYTTDGQNIEFLNTDEAKAVIKELKSSQTIGLSRRSKGKEVDGKIEDIETYEYSFIGRPSVGELDMMNTTMEALGKSFNGPDLEPTFEINEVIESDGGTWQLFKEHGSDVHQLEYWLPDGDRPQVVLNLTKEEFQDLETLFPNIKKYRDEK